MWSVANGRATRRDQIAKDEVLVAIRRLSHWLEENRYSAYDTFDGLSSPVFRPLTAGNKILEMALQQGIRRCPINLRPVAGIRRSPSSKGMGFLARAFIRLHDSTGEEIWAERARFALQWLTDNQAGGYSGACWGNHFDYRCRSFYLPKGVPTVVWTSLIGHAFIDGYVHFSEHKYLEVAISSCEHIQNDLEAFQVGDGACITYVPGLNSQVHNANTLAASLLARVYSITHDRSCRELAEKAIRYTAECQRPDGSWYYGEKQNLHWVDNFHTAYVLDCFRHYADGAGDGSFEQVLDKGYQYWKSTFFLDDGTPKYYSGKMLPIDIQCSAQAIDTLTFFSERDPAALDLALKIARWTIQNMQDPSGYFYYRRYSSWLVNKTPTLHWGQATMMSALSSLYQAL